ncbi:MAG: M42 family peptidase, partial [Clostridia bacterium]|nr:M42 family peptidase [Clostridia bacterium]
EEVGLRGAAPAAYAVKPDFCINVDVTHANDAPGAKGPVRLGGGVCIKYKDRSVICDRAMISHLETVADREKIKTQVDILTVGGTDTGPIQSSRAGVLSGALSIPLRYMHTDAETADLSDLEGAVKLLCAAVKHEILL